MTRDIPSDFIPDCEDATINSAPPKDTSMWVLKPAGLPQRSRWAPITAPKNMAITNRRVSATISFISGNPEMISSKMKFMTVSSRSEERRVGKERKYRREVGDWRKK